MDDIGTITRCGGCDFDSDSYVHLCKEPASYRAEFRWLDDDRLGDDDPRDYVIPVCVRHANAARNQRSLKRIYTDGAHVAAAAD